MENKGEILLYKNDKGNIKLEVNFQDETVWLTQEQMALLFGKGRSTITEHIINVYKEGELEQKRTCRKFRQVRQEGLRTIEREIEYYNLDVIISVGYRVKSQQGTHFRIWATQFFHEIRLSVRIIFFTTISYPRQRMNLIYSIIMPSTFELAI